MIGENHTEDAILKTCIGLGRSQGSFTEQEVFDRMPATPRIRNFAPRLKADPVLPENATEAQKQQHAWKLEGKCPQCGTPCAPYRHCPHHRDMAMYSPVLRQLRDEGILSSERKGHKLMWTLTAKGRAWHYNNDPKRGKAEPLPRNRAERRAQQRNS